jgi:hypothetical protein
LIIILKVGSLFEALPKVINELCFVFTGDIRSIFQACLASIIVVALKGLFLQTKDIYIIGRVTKLEAVNRKSNSNI